MTTEAGESRGPLPYLAGQDAGDLVIHGARGHGQVTVAAADTLRAGQVEACGAARAMGQRGRLQRHWRGP